MHVPDPKPIIPTNTLARLWNRLTAPTPAVAKPRERYQVCLLSIVALLLSLVWAVMMVFTPAALLAAAFYALSYGLSRTRHYRAALYLFFALGIGCTVVMAVYFMGTPGLIYLPLFTGFGVALLSLRANIVYAAITITTAALVIGLETGKIGEQDTLTPGTTLLIIVLSTVGILITSLVPYNAWQHIKLQTQRFVQSEARMRSLLDSIPGVISIIDQEGNILTMHSAVLRNEGLDLRRVVGVNLLDFATPDYKEPIRQVFKEVFQTGKIAHYESHTYEGIWYENQIAPICEDGKIVAATVISVDITRRKQIEESLRKSEASLRSLLDNVPGIITIIDRQGQILSMHSAPLTAQGTDLERYAGTNLYELLIPEEREKSRSIIEAVFITGKPGDYETLGADGRWYQTRVMPVVQGGEITTLTMISFDIHERKQVEDELRRAKDAAEAANRAKSAFLANMSHELRTPLNAILGFAQLMERDKSITKMQQENLSIITRSGEHLLHLINDVLEMSKIEAGRITLHPSDFDLFRMLDSLESMFRARAESRDLQLNFIRSPNVLQYVRTDESKLRQVLINLIGNAIKFTPSGQVNVYVHGFDVESTSMKISFTVEDSGPGILRADIPHLFDVFTQTQSGHKAQEGTGLGLAISREFVRLMGGDIYVQSEVGKGSRFTFDIEIGLALPENIRPAQAASRVIGLEVGQPTFRILVAEDKWENRILLVRLLYAIGFDVREATNGLECIEICQAWQPDLIFMDMRMPVMDGYEATRQIKAAPNARQIAIIALTASAFDHERIAIMEAGCDDLILKPFREEDVFDKMAQHLNVRFVYEQSSLLPVSPTTQTKKRLSADDFSTLPREWVRQLHQAALIADLQRTQTLITEIKDQHTHVATALTDLVNSFRFDTITSLTKPLENNP